MFSRYGIRPLVAAISLWLSGCGSLPLVEGNAVVVAGRNQKESPALNALSKIDQVTELDPLNLGCVDPHTTPQLSLVAQTVPIASGVSGDDTSRLECALKGFYSYAYFENLSDEERKTLQVNNITNAFAENAINRHGDLAKSIQDAKDAKYY